MKNTTLSIATAFYLLTALPTHSNAGFLDNAWQTTKEVANKALIFKNEHLEEIDFSTIYPKPFYKKSYFGWVITGVAVIGAGAFTYITAGAGAPAAATGASAVASWVAGGGAGSYMAGLSMIGSWFGGNALLGAAILNGLSIGLIGGGLGAKLATMGILAKVGMGISITALGLDGIAYFSNEETGKLEYRVRVIIPKDLGSKRVRHLVEEIYDTNENMQEALKDNDGRKQKELFDELQRLKKNGIALLNNKINNGDYNPEDLLVLAIIASNEAEYSLFSKALSLIDRSKLKKMGFLYYLDALDSLYHGNQYDTLSYLESSMNEDSYALEPVILHITILGYSDFRKNEQEIKDLIKFAEDNFDSDKYATPLSMVSLYYRVGTLYFINKRYAGAEHYFKKAKENLGFLQKHFFAKQLIHTIDLSIANSMYKQGKTSSASNIYHEILNDINNDNIEEIKRIRGQYLGNEK